MGSILVTGRVTPFFIRIAAIYNRCAMQPARIAELLSPFLDPIDRGSLTVDDLDRISIYIDILLRWNARINLTAIRNEEEIVTRHFGESLFAASHLCSRNDVKARGVTLADLGSGAGFPGIPIKLWVPHLHVTLIESNHKKAAFLREVVRVLTLTNIDILNIRAESLTGQNFDTVTFRAIEHFESILPAAARLLKPTGRLALLIGSAQIAQAQQILSKLNWSAPVTVPLSRNRVLAIAHQ